MDVDLELRSMSGPKGPRTKDQRPGPGLHTKFGLPPCSFRMTFRMTIKTWDFRRVFKEDLEGDFEGYFKGSSRDC